MSARGKRRWQPREMQMVSEFLTKHFADRRWKTRVRLGSPPEALMSPERAVTVREGNFPLVNVVTPFSFRQP